MQYLRDLNRRAFSSWSQRFALGIGTIAAAAVFTLVPLVSLFHSPVDFLYSLAYLVVFPFGLYTILSPYLDIAAGAVVQLITDSRSRDLTEALIRWALWSLYPALVLALTLTRASKVARLLYLLLLALLVLNVAGCIRVVGSIKTID